MVGGFRVDKVVRRFSVIFFDAVWWRSGFGNVMGMGCVEGVALGADCVCVRVCVCWEGDWSWGWVSFYARMGI